MQEKQRETVAKTADVAEMSAAQRRYLARGLDQPGGKLPLFDRNGQAIKASTIDACIKAGWAEPWYQNPIKPDWLVCKLTPKGRVAVSRAVMPAATTKDSS